MQYDPPDIAVSTLRVARIIHFCVHNFCVGESNHMRHAFALVDWVACVPSRYLIGKPIEIWAASSFDTLYKTSLLPLENISSLLITCVYQFDSMQDSMLVTTPLLL